MASLVSIGLKVESFKPKPAGIRQMMRSKQMQGVLFDAADLLASDITATAYEGAEYDAGPIGEPVTSAVGAHAFVRSANFRARLNQAYHDELSSGLDTNVGEWNIP